MFFEEQAANYDAYAVIFDAKNERIGLVQTKDGEYTLPGGKIAQGETDVECLERSARETLGAELEVSGYLGTALQSSPLPREEEHMESGNLFYLGKIVKKAGQPREDCHNLEWLHLHEAVQKVKDQQHKWAVEEGISAIQSSTLF
ncbi:NUDIX domain-containing protein [Heyndrickxia acidiproducens]|uniref:NUDIX domain-containing protein n=1 Tax=Heyndrickxia acidiproducens TaxID=1121084 RepID=UPI000379F594|nr:NUDIX domain-containing protein [Heyndrickxia acidiproducens]